MVSERMSRREPSLTREPEVCKVEAGILLEPDAL